MKTLECLCGSEAGFQTFEKITHFNKKSGPIGGREDLKKDKVLN